MFKGLSREKLKVKIVEKWNLLGPLGLALKEQKPKDHKYIEQKPKKKKVDTYQDQVKTEEIQNAEERKGVSRKKRCKSKVQAFILDYISFNIL